MRKRDKKIVGGLLIAGGVIGVGALVYAYESGFISYGQLTKSIAATPSQTTFSSSGGTLTVTAGVQNIPDGTTLYLFGALGSAMMAQVGSAPVSSGQVIFTYSIPPNATTGTLDWNFDVSDSQLNMGTVSPLITVMQEGVTPCNCTSPDICPNPDGTCPSGYQPDPSHSGCCMPVPTGGATLAITPTSGPNLTKVSIKLTGAKPNTSTDINYGRTASSLAGFLYIFKTENTDAQGAITDTVTIGVEKGGGSITEPAGTYYIRIQQGTTVVADHKFVQTT